MSWNHLVSAWIVSNWRQKNLCGTEENLHFFNSINNSQIKIEGNSEKINENFTISDTVIIYRPYGIYKPRAPYTQTVISLLEKNPMIIKLEFTTIGGFYEYFECVEKYFFSFESEAWKQISYWDH